MKRLILIATAVAVTVVPSAASAETNEADQTNAAKECRAERGSTTASREAFRARYGTNKNGKNAFGKCVSTRSRAERVQRLDAAKNSAKQCRAERAQLGAAAFGAKYGTGKKAKNAFGKCVAQAAKAKKQAADQADAKTITQRKIAAKTCAAERAQNRDAFAGKYGTNQNKRNAFGKCVSTTAKQTNAQWA